MKRALSLKAFFFGIVAGGALLWGLLALWIELLPSSVLPAEYMRNIGNQAIFRRCDRPDVVILGDSRPEVGIVANDLEASTINFSEGGFNPVVDFYRARMLLSCPYRPKLVILSYSMMSLVQISSYLANVFFLDRVLSNAEQQEIFSAVESSHDRILLRDLSGFDLSPLAGPIMRLRAFLYRIDFPVFYAPSILNSLESGVVQRWHANEQTFETKISINHPTGSLPAGRSDAIFGDAEISKVPRSPVIDDYFEKLVHLFSDQHVAVLIATLPINQPTSDAIDSVTKQALQTYFRHFIDGHSYVSITEPVLVPWPATMFGDDAGHSNRFGQSVLTRLMDRCIQHLLATSAGPESKACSFEHDAF